MKLYLIRHAQPKSYEEDPRMPLSDLGQKIMRKISEHAADRMNLVISQIWHSDKLRAKETAAILAESLGITDKMKEQKGLGPNDDVFPMQNRLTEVEGNLAIVGHLPFLSKLASLLLCGRTDAGMIRFETGSIVCLSRDDYDNWTLDWMITPDIIGSL
ncbi:MAG: phosphohistidine phosphatase SixA [bacterium]